MGLGEMLRGLRRRTAATVLVLGLDHSGKTTLLRALSEANPTPSTPSATDLVIPTVGTTETSFQNGGVVWVCREAGGAARHRALWERHYRTADAIIYVVDAADHLRLVVAREELETALAHPALSARRVPLLVLAHKADLPHAKPPTQLAQALGLDRWTDREWHVVASSAVRKPGQPSAGTGLADGLAWLARALRHNAR